MQNAGFPEKNICKSQHTERALIRTFLLTQLLR